MITRALGGEPDVSVLPLSTFLCGPDQTRRTELMEKYRIPIFVAVERLQEASEQAGLTEDDIGGLLASGLDISDAVTYVEAMLSNRVH
jgi:hypothetical protein